MITLKDLSIGYRDSRHVREVAAHLCGEVCVGELTCLLGSNGVGKSTLIRTLAGFQPALSGEVLLDGRRLSGLSERQLARSVGVVLTERLMVRNMSVEEVIGLGRSPYTGFWGRLSSGDRFVVGECADRVGVSHLLGRMVDSLSDGERQKVMIAKALAQQTPIILLDEPTAFIDYPGKVELFCLLRRLCREEGKTILLSTHDVELALALSDGVWLVGAGGLCVGSPEDLALDGCLSGFFSSGSVGFDSSSGVFVPCFRTDCRVLLCGVGVRADMVRKALRRNGVDAVGVGECVVRVDVLDDCFVVTHRGGRSERVDRVSEVVRCVCG